MKANEISVSNLQSPAALRKHIALVGKTNSGKSSLLNALCNQEVSLVSELAGTTTDPVYKAMELAQVGAVTYIDTAGFEDSSSLGKERVRRTMEALKKADVILLLLDKEDHQSNLDLYARTNQFEVPVVVVLNKVDEGDAQFPYEFAGDIIRVSAKEHKNIDLLLNRLGKILKSEESYITRDLVKQGDVVLLVMPQDIQAPKGRLILPQVQTIRELLDRKCLVLSATTDMLPDMLKAANKIDLVITDSQAFHEVDRILPKNMRLTSFSVLFAGYKGDIDYFIQSARNIDSLNEHSKVLISEACTHAPKEEDIGTVKIPNLLRRKYGNMQIDFVRGNDFAQNIRDYDLVIHCGACMFNRQYVLNRVKLCKEHNVPLTNYGITIAKINGILDRIVV